MRPGYERPASLSVAHRSEKKRAGYSHDVSTAYAVGRAIEDAVTWPRNPKAERFLEGLAFQKERPAWKGAFEPDGRIPGHEPSPLASSNREGEGLARAGQHETIINATTRQKVVLRGLWADL